MVRGGSSNTRVRRHRWSPNERNTSVERNFGRHTQPEFGINVERDRQRFVLPPQSIRSASPKKLNRQGRPMRSLDANHILKVCW
jgi:hypothetical protein